MDYREAKEKFIQTWGVLGASWGINKTMAQIHAVLLISPKALTTEEIMEELNISRGNASMNLRALIDWGIVYRENRPGERKEYFYSEKDLWRIVTQVTRERRKRELEPVLRMLGQVKELKEARTEEAAEFRKMTGQLHDFAKKTDGMLDTFMKAEENWFFGKFLRLFK